jgi:pimeloyl-ACP methyl ester carboxylesterase
MSDTKLETSYTETPVFFGSGECSLFGIVSLPRTVPERRGLIILPGATAAVTTGRNRLSVRVCRALASAGCTGLRLDYHGVGESTGKVDQFRLDRPFVQDVAAGVACLREMGVEQVILAGYCFGARTALSTAAQLEDIEAVFLVSPSLRDYALGERTKMNRARRWGFGHYAREAVRPTTFLGLFDRRKRRSYMMFVRTKLRVTFAKLPGIHRWPLEKPIGTDLIAPGFVRPLRILVERRVPVHFIYGAEDGLLREFRTAASGPLADILDESLGSVRLTVFPGRIHGLASVASQDAVANEIVDWVRERSSAARTSRRAAEDEHV